MILTDKQRRQILSAVRKRVLKNHFNVAGVNYGDWAKLYDNRSAALLKADASEFETGVQEILKELHSSHTGFYHEQPNRLLSQHTINATLSAFPEVDGQRWYFLDVFHAGPADRAGIKPGDMLWELDGTPYEASVTPPFRTGKKHVLVVSDAHGRNRREIPIDVPRRKGNKNLPPILPPKSIVPSVAAPGVGLLRITWFPGSMGLGFAKSLDEAITALRSQNCDRLVIDLRGNIGGGLGFARLASYLYPNRTPIGYSLTPKRLRNGYKTDDLEHVVYPDSRMGFATTLARFAVRDKSIFLLTQGLGNQPFHKRTAILVNQWTNSAAEMVASFASENRLATIIGKRTAGNVLGAVNFKVGGGYFLRLPVFGWYTSQGKCIEGNGVSPDLTVEVDPAELNEGNDRQLATALNVLTSAN